MGCKSQKEVLLEIRSTELNNLAKTLADMLRDELIKTTTNLLEVTLKAADGVRIEIRPRDHHPPHFHVTSGGQTAAFDISTCDMLQGRLDPRDLRVVKDWYNQNKTGLLNVWDKTRPRTCSIGESSYAPAIGGPTTH